MIVCVRGHGRNWYVHSWTSLFNQWTARRRVESSREDCHYIGVAIEAKHYDWDCKEGPKIPAEQKDVVKWRRPCGSYLPGPYYYGYGCIDEAHNCCHADL